MEIEYFESEGGKSDVKDFLEGLPYEQRKAYLRTLEKFTDVGLLQSQKAEVVKRLHKEHPEIYELRPKWNRILFHIKGNVCWLLEAFPKKFDKVKTRFINKAINRAKRLY